VIVTLMARLFRNCHAEATESSMQSQLEAQPMIHFDLASGALILCGRSRYIWPSLLEVYGLFITGSSNRVRKSRVPSTKLRPSLFSPAHLTGRSGALPPKTRRPHVLLMTSSIFQGDSRSSPESLRQLTYFAQSS
jgi:hypothetical protein